MSTPADDSLGALLGLLSVVVSLALYVWTALALSAMFRKMGEDAWKGWVPLLNTATVLAWGGFSPWLILLAFIPIVGALVVLVLLIVSAHRINSGFGYGGGMTVLAALLFVVWASILGFGPARWLGARRRARVAAPDGARPAADPAVAAAAAPAAPVPPVPPAAVSRGAEPASALFGGPVFDDVSAHGASSVPEADAAANTSPADWMPAEEPAPAASPRSPEADSSFAPPSSPGVDRWTPPAQSGAAVPDEPAPLAASAPTSAPAVPAPPSEAPATEPDADRADADEVEDAAWPSEIDDVSAIHPSPFPPSAAGSRPFVAPPVGLVGESGVTGATAATAATGATGSDPGPIAFVPGRRAGSEPPPPPSPVTRVPAVRPGDAETPARVGDPNAAIFAQPARPRPAADPDPDGFLELSGEVSAVVGAPAAGRPRSAMGAVSAQHRRVDDVDDDEGVDELTRATRPSAPGLLDDIDQTVVARRSVRPTWELVPAVGSPLPLTAPVVILGRRPSADPAFPAAQLLAVAGDARTVSKTHARIEQRGESWIVTDLGSTNGVLVRTLMGDEVEVEQGGQLDAGERFFLGDEEFHLRRITR